MVTHFVVPAGWGSCPPRLAIFLCCFVSFCFIVILFGTIYPMIVYVQGRYGNLVVVSPALSHACKNKSSTSKLPRKRERCVHVQIAAILYIFTFSILFFLIQIDLLCKFPMFNCVKCTFILNFHHISGKHTNRIEWNRNKIETKNLYSVKLIQHPLMRLRSKSESPDFIWFQIPRNRFSFSELVRPVPPWSNHL